MKYRIYDVKNELATAGGLQHLLLWESAAFPLDDAREFARQFRDIRTGSNIILTEEREVPIDDHAGESLDVSKLRNESDEGAGPV